MTTRTGKTSRAASDASVAAPVPVWTLHDWVVEVAGLGGDPVLPERAVIVPNVDAAECLRRLMIEAGEGGGLVGTRMVTPLQAASEVLARAGEVRQTIEDRVRPTRFLALLKQALGLQYFDEALVRSTPGWEYAFPRTIAELEAVGLEADAFARLGKDARFGDIALVWRALDGEARGLSVAGAMALAAELLAGRPELWLCTGETFAVVSPETSPVVASFVQAVPRLRLGVQILRPQTAERAAALEAMAGRAVAQVWRSAARPAETKTAQTATTERGLLATYLLADPAECLSPKRPRSAGADGTVTLEDFAGVEEEVAAATRWVAERVKKGMPLAELAVVTPTPDPYVALLAARIRELPGAPAVYVAGGVPLTGLATGARALSVVRALRGWLSVDLLAEVLPALRPPAGVAPAALSGSAGQELAYALGTVGGSSADWTGALQWPTRLAARAEALRQEIAAGEAEDLDPDQVKGGRAVAAAKRLLAKVEAVTPGVGALVELVERIARGTSTKELARRLAAFFGAWLWVPNDEQEALHLIDEVVQSHAEADPRGELDPGAALQLIEESLLGLRLRRGRYGEPAVYVGPLARAADLTFTAVRVVGLGEGSVPQTPRDNPLFPEPLREAAAGKGGPAALLPTAQSRSQRRVGDLVRVVWAASEHVAWSAPRTDAERTAKEPSSLFIDAATAIGRGLGAKRGTSVKVVPESSDLDALYFEPARQARRQALSAAPLGEADWLDRAAAGEDGVPPGWTDAQVTALERLVALRAEPDRPALLGQLADETPTPELPGLTKAHGISASRLEKLLGCPRYFLFTSVLGWGEPSAAPEIRRIGQPMYGSLLHEVHETFFRAHGAAFGARKKSLDHWQALGAVVAEEALAGFVAHYPLVGESVVEQERRRLLADFAALLEYDWAGGRKRRFVATEQEFGFDEALGLSLGSERLYVRGRIDRLDEEGGVTWVRDLKSGKAHPRRGDEAGPTLGVDTQLGLYCLVTRKLAKGWGVPAKVAAAYVYPVTAHDPEREFSADYPALEAATKSWLTVARELLATRAFVPSPVSSACEYCAFAPVCGADATQRAQALMSAQAEESVLRRYLAFFIDQDSGGDGDEEGGGA